MPDITIDKFPSSTPTSNMLIPMYNLETNETEKGTVAQIRNIAQAIAEGGLEKTASNENLKSVNSKVDLLSQSVDNSFQTVNQNFQNVENEIQGATNAINSANQNIANHEEDSSVHVTIEKKTEWNKNTTDIVNINTSLSERVKQSTVTTTYYVSPTGLDTNDGLTSGTAFKTIQHAIDMLPQIINHTITINVASGTYAEIPKVSGFGGKGVLNLTGDSTTSTTRTITAIEISNCSLLINVGGFNLSSTTDGVKVDYSMGIKFSNMNIITSSTSYGFYINMSNAQLSNCTISNHSTGIMAYTNSHVLSLNTSGSGNTTALNALYGGVIAKAGTQTGGTTSESTSFGGKIISHIPSSSLGTSGYRYNDDGSIEQWTALICGSSGTIVTFPIAFPNNCLNIEISILAATAGQTAYFSTLTKTQVTVYCSSSQIIHIRAIGN